MKSDGAAKVSNEAFVRPLPRSGRRFPAYPRVPRREHRLSKTLTIIIPVYNGARTVGHLVERLMESRPAEVTRVVLVNDGSPDDSDRVCRGLYEKFRGSIVYVRLARNFGEHNAVMAGLHHAAGDYAVIMDDDFQNPPEEVPGLVRHAAEHGYDVVYTRYRRKRHSSFRNMGSIANDRAATLLLGKPRDLYLSSFKCLSSFVVGELIKHTGPRPYIDGLILRATRNIGTYEVRHDPRREGRSNYTVAKLTGLWFDMAVGYSLLPIRAGLGLGLASVGSGMVLGLAAAATLLARPGVAIGWVPAIAVALILAGAQLVTVGIAGEYAGRAFLALGGAPQFVVRETLGGGENGT